MRVASVLLAARPARRVARAGRRAASCRRSTRRSTPTRAAVGLLVPGAGPTVTRDSALTALLRGQLEHELLGGVAPGDALIELGDPSGPEILVSLPPPGRSENDRRYPIALLGARGLLTSDSTRIDGLVSVTDVATGRLRVVDERRPGRGARDARRPDRTERPSAPAADDRACRAPDRARARPARARSPRAARRARREPLARPGDRARRRRRGGRSSRSGSPARRSSPPTWSRWVSMRRLSRSRRSALPSPAASTGSTTCSRRCCSSPSLVGAALLGRAGIGVAALAFVTIGGNRFGADGGGIVVLAAAYLVLCSCACAAEGRRSGLPPASSRARSRSRCCCSGSTLRPAARATSPTPSATARSRSRGDLADRIELSVRRTAASAGRSPSCSARSRSSSPSPCAARATQCSTPSSPASRSRSSSTTRRATCSEWAPRSRSRLRGTCTAGRASLDSATMRRAAPCCRSRPHAGPRRLWRRRGGLADCPRR